MKSKSKHYTIECFVLLSVAMACFGAAAAAPAVYQPVLQLGVVGVSASVGFITLFYAGKAALHALLTPVEMDPSALTGSQN